jgi:hypothetical protein
MFKLFSNRPVYIEAKFNTALSMSEFHPPFDLPLVCRTQGKQITGTNLRRQAVFALVLNTSTSTVQKRKTGEKTFRSLFKAFISLSK